MVDNSCPFCGGEIEETHGYIGAKLSFFKCQNHKCGAVISFNNFWADTGKVPARKYFEQRAEGSAYQAGYKDGYQMGVTAERK